MFVALFTLCVLGLRSVRKWFQSNKLLNHNLEKKNCLGKKSTVLIKMTTSKETMEKSDNWKKTIIKMGRVFKYTIDLVIYRAHCYH